MLIGEYEHNVDTKGRIIVPAKLREGLGSKFVITKGLDKCLFAYSIEEWENFELKLRTLPLTNSDARAFIRFFFSGATVSEIDKQGRVLIPSNLRKHALIQKEVVIIGVSTRVEIWDREHWKEYNSYESMSADEIAQKMEYLGI